MDINWDDAIICKGNNYRIKKLLEKEQINLIGFGGSITQGSLASRVENSYSYLVYNWLKERFPDKLLNYFNCGVGGTGSLYGAFRINRDVAVCDPDLVLIDYSVNDTADSESLDTFEGTIRQLLSLPSRPALIILGNVFYDRGESAQVIHSMIARHYDLPMISMDTTLYRLVLEGKIDRRSFTPDDLHPDDRGHGLLAQSIEHFLEMTFESTSLDRDLPIPEPFSSDIYSHINSVDVRLNGFVRHMSRRKTVQDRFVEGYEGYNKGDSLIFSGYGTSISLMYRQVVSATDMSPNATAYVDGVKVAELTGSFDETWGENMKTAVVASGLPFGKHELVVTVTQTHDDDTKPFYLNGAGFAGKKPDIIFLDPVCTHNVWGGTRIRTDFGYDVSGDDIGECWGVSAHPNGDGTVRNGEFAGKKLSEVYYEHPELFFSGKKRDFGYSGSCAFYEDGHAPEDEKDIFPLLIKIIDAKTDLSIQVHPDDQYAAIHENGALGKKECWYVLDTPEGGGELVIGHNAKTHEDLVQMVSDGKWDQLIRKVPVHKGDFIQIDPGTVHAIKGGMLILETQQNSDITYRVYDYDRLYHGNKRELHVKQSLDVIKVPAASLDNCVIRHDQIESESKENELQEIYRCDKYTVMKLSVDGKADIMVSDRFYTASVISGSGTIDGREIKKGDFFILPAGYGEAECEGTMDILFSKV